MRDLIYAQRIVQKLIYAPGWRLNEKLAKKINFAWGNLTLWRIEKNEGRNIMTEFLIALLAVYAVWSAHKIMRLSAVLHLLVRALTEVMEEE